MKTRFRSTAVMILPLLLIAAVAARCFADKPSTTQAAGTPLYLQTVDGKWQVALSADWVETKLPAPFVDVTALRAINKKTHVVLALIYQEDTDSELAHFANSMWLDMQKSMSDLKVAGPSKLKVSGHDSLQYEVTGTAPGKPPCGQIVTFIRTEKHIIILTLIHSDLARFEKMKEEMKLLVNAVTEAPQR